VQRAVAWLLEAFASEHLLLTAMHYRWAEPYSSDQRHFLDAEFGRVSHIGPDREARLAAGARMIQYFSATLPTLGGTPETAPAIEAAYLELLDRLDVHFQHVPYLLGGHPSIADFGFMAPFFGHLGRDPAAAHLMATRAPNVARWKERMNLAVIGDAEFPDCAPALPADDALPPTLEPILELVFRDWTDELAANFAAYNDWGAANPALPSGHLVCLDGKRRVHPTLGPIAYRLRDRTVRCASAVQTVWHFDKAVSVGRAIGGPARVRFDALVERCGGEEAMRLTLARPIVRQDYVLVLG
jgi:hypothetical protein